MRENTYLSEITFALPQPLKRQLQKRNIGYTH